MKVRDTIRLNKNTETVLPPPVLDTSILDSGVHSNIADHYTKTCDLGGFFSRMMEKVLQRKPKEPFGYMVSIRVL
jgi:hypothetical protein